MLVLLPGRITLHTKIVSTSRNTPWFTPLHVTKAALQLNDYLSFFTVSDRVHGAFGVHSKRSSRRGRRGISPA